MPDAAAAASLRQPVVAGLVTALVGFTSSCAVVIAGLRAVESVSGLALLAAFAAALRGALDDPDHRTGSAVAFLVAASGLTILGVGGAFWALVLGLAVRWGVERPARGTA